MITDQEARNLEAVALDRFDRVRVLLDETASLLHSLEGTWVTKEETGGNDRVYVRAYLVLSAHVHRHSRRRGVALHASPMRLDQKGMLRAPAGANGRRWPQLYLKDVQVLPLEQQAALTALYETLDPIDRGMVRGRVFNATTRKYEDGWK